jgi:class 3 adenylate cyclase/tetratricopeptide (TPR) repeat protein
MKCPKCQAEITESAKFCSECGCELRDVIAAPLKAYRHPHTYTPKFLADKILTTRSAIEGERKLVTVLFADVVNYTAMAEKLDPEEAHQIMDGCFRILLDEIHECHGTINQFTGDGVMALFGAPLALEDHAQRACHAALAIQQGMKRFAEEVEQKFGLEFKMRVGLNSGPVIVGAIGDDLRMDYTAVGDTTNLAARMEGIAEPATVLVSPHTYNEVSQQFEFKPLGKVQVKGKKRSLEVYELIKEKVMRPRLGLERMIYSEMVGRDTELEQLELQVIKAAQGEGSIVNIIGEAGIGKSRLVSELKKRDVIKKVNLFEGRAISTGRNLSFHPIIDLLKHWARIGEDDGGAAALRKLETAIKRVYPEGVHEVLPFVATLMGMKLSGRYAERVKGIEGEALEKLILKNMRDLLTKATELNPLVIVTEDLHWADTSSIELMESLFRLAESQRILFVNVFRPDHKETGDRIVETLKESLPAHYVDIEIQPLDERMSETLISNMLQIKGLQHAVINQIVERADGNPFFIEEVVRSFIDHGAVVQKDGTFEVTDKINKMVIPHTINDVLMARIDRLEEKTRDLVKIASVIGRSFFYRILKEMTKTIEDIDSRLSYLQEIQLFRERKRMEEVEYLFKHALAQEAAYESILLQTRRELHLKMADAIEKVFKARLHEFYGMLAYHYSQGEDLDKAEEYMIKAGEEAMGSSASREALHYYQEALSLYLKKYGDTADPEKLAVFEKNIANALFNKGEFEDAMDYFDSALRRWGIKLPRNKILMVIKLLFDLLMVTLKLYFPTKKSRKMPTQRDRDIFNLSRNKCIALVSVNPMRMFAEVIGDIKRILKFDLGKIESGYDTLFSGASIFTATALSYRLSNKFLEYGERFIDKNNLRELFELRFHRDLHSTSSGQWDDIQDYDALLVDENLKVGLFWEVTYYLHVHIMSKVSRGKLNDVYPLLEKVSKIFDDYEYKFAKQIRLMGELAFFIQRRGLDDAQKVFEKYDLLFKMGSDMETVNFLGFKAEVQILSNDYDGAEKSLRQAEQIYRKHGIVFPFMVEMYLRSRFSLDILLFEGSILSYNKSNISTYRKQARKSCERLLKNTVKSAASRSEAYELLGQYYWIISRQKKAVKWWKRSIEEGERLGVCPDLARTYMEIGKRFLEEKSRYKELNGIHAKEYLKKARTMFQEMDLQWDLDELEKVRNEMPHMPV